MARKLTIDLSREQVRMLHTNATARAQALLDHAACSEEATRDERGRWLAIARETGRTIACDSARMKNLTFDLSREQVRTLHEAATDRVQVLRDQVASLGEEHSRWLAIARETERALAFDIDRMKGSSNP